MPTARIIAKYKNEPKAGKKRWTIKDPTDVLWGAMPDVAATIQQGGTYDITYRVENFQGKNYNVIESAKEASPPPPPQAVAATTTQASGAAYRPYDADTQKRIFVCGALNAMLSNPTMFQTPPAADTLISIINVLCTAHHNSMLSKGQKWNEEQGDEIPFE